MLGIGIYRFGRRSMLYCVLCKETPTKTAKKKNLLRRALPKNDKTCYFGVFMRPVCYILNFFHRIGKRE